MWEETALAFNFDKSQSFFEQLDILAVHLFLFHSRFLCFYYSDNKNEKPKHAEREKR